MNNVTLIDTGSSLVASQFSEGFGVAGDVVWLCRYGWWPLPSVHGAYSLFTAWCIAVDLDYDSFSDKSGYFDRDDSLDADVLICGGVK